MVVIVAYFAIMAILGLVAWKKNTTSDDYFVAGKKLGTFSLAAMWLSTWIGGASIVGTVSDSYSTGIAGGWYVTILAVGTFLFGITFTKLTKRLGDKLKNITYPALIESRYDRRTGSIVVICCFFANIGYLASQLVALGTMLSTITGWEPFTSFVVGTLITVAYSAIGGLMAITYTTWVQFILILLGTVFLGMPISAHAIGGIGNISSLPAEFFDLGRTGWATTLALGVSSIFSFYTSMSSYTRCFAAKNSKVARAGTLWAAAGVFGIAIGATYMGLAAKVLMPELRSGTSPYAALVGTYFPAGVSGLVMVGVLAAIMSTGVVSINGCATNISVDIYRERMNPNAPDKKVRHLGIISSFIVGIAGAALAWWKYNVIDLLLLAFTFQAASLFFPTVMGVFWKKPTSKAAFYSMAASFAVVVVWLIGEALELGSIFTVDALWPGLLTSLVVMLAVTYLVPPTEQDKENAERFCSISLSKTEE